MYYFDLNWLMFQYVTCSTVIITKECLMFIIMRKVETQLITSGNQFGFIREHGTDLCIFIV